MATDAAQQPEPEELAAQSALLWIQTAVGAKLLAYLLGCDIEALPGLISTEVKLTDKQREIVRGLSTSRKSIPDGLLSQISAEDLLQRYLTRVQDTGKYVASSMHEHVAGPMEVVTDGDAIERALATLAIDTYPAFLLPPDPALASALIPPSSPPIGRLLFVHPQQKAFVEAVRQDATFSRIIDFRDSKEDYEAAIQQDDPRDPAAMYLRTVSDMLLTSAWCRLGQETPTPDTFVSAALEGLRLLRRAYAGEPCTVPVKVAFTGVLLPPGQQLELVDAIVRAVTEAERRFVPQTIKGQLSSGVDESGRITIINYDGDIVLEYNVPYQVQPSDEGISRWGIPISLPSNLEQTVTRLRFSLMLAMEHEHRVQLVETWQGHDTPLHYNFLMQWHDRKPRGLRPIQLTDADLRAWHEWYDRLNNPQVANIKVALSRILKATAERTEPSDVLIDSMIAWENIFSRECGVTKCLATLLEQDEAVRKERKAKLNDMYDLRSKVVHGGPALSISEQRLCDEALEVAIQAVRILVSDRVDLLTSENSIRRGRALLSGL